MAEQALTKVEFEVLAGAGYQPRGGGIAEDGEPYLKFRKDVVTTTGSRSYWRAVIADLQKPPTEDAATFGPNVWVYCRQHMRPHETGWCSVSPRDKVGLGVTTAQEAQQKCRDWGFELYADRQE